MKENTQNNNVLSLRRNYVLLKKPLVNWIKAALSPNVVASSMYLFLQLGSVACVYLYTFLLH